ncbi:hypothetical protein Q7C_796 [Methylophaga frappieri]|uniref:DUF4197 domain-containing protein n=1 Tax=Methylophaga frappieri (strain ATCC BAA-2434 / DSM 25690 / JAM7) TaxID=754477 RepID=I1YGC2_METFJ|nr:DUF4197 domain-containing protein [Methylophaga frappieri]AFJ01965.1 hypothetical protein Q7C_796 [Methylophaga frappieri]
MKTASTWMFLTFLFLTPAHADFGKMLEDFKSAGKTMLGQEQSHDGEGLANDTIIDGLREALTLGSQRAIDTIGQEGGFLNNAAIRIPLPPRVQKVSDVMKKFGMSQLADDFENSMNRAAEQAAPEATSILVDAIRSMSISDAKTILQGDQDAATRYFEDKTRPRLATLFSPIVEDSLNNVGATRYYNQLDSKMQAVPVVGQNLNVDLNEYVTQQALDGLFIMLAAEEQKIRENPAARTTSLLKQVFGK